jgi:hypothetical protein
MLHVFSRNSVLQICIQHFIFMEFDLLTLYLTPRGAKLRSEQQLMTS